MDEFTFMLSAHIKHTMPGIHSKSSKCLMKPNKHILLSLSLDSDLYPSLLVIDLHKDEELINPPQDLIKLDLSQGIPALFLHAVCNGEEIKADTWWNVEGFRDGCYKLVCDEVAPNVTGRFSSVSLRRRDTGRMRVEHMAAGWLAGMGGDGWS